MASANILARHGRQQPCEDVLTETRGVYESYLSNLQREGATQVDLPNGASDRSPLPFRS